MKLADQVSETRDIFFQAIKSGNTLLFKVLLVTLLNRFKIEEIIDSKYNATPLHWAANYGHLEITQLLVEEFPQLIDSLTPDNSTPILYAVINDQTEVVKFLTPKVASLIIRSQSGKTPLSAAAEKSDAHPIKMFLKKHQNRLNEQFIQAIQSEDLMLAAMCLDVGAEVDTPIQENINNTKYTALFYVCSTGNIDLVKLLISRKANLNSLGPNDSTPLHVAVSFNHQQIVQLLKNEGAELLRDTNNQTPVDVAKNRAMGHMITILDTSSEQEESISQDKTGFEPPQLNINYYEELVKSIPGKDRDSLFNELESLSIRQRAEKLCEELASEQCVGLDVSESRTMFLAALRNLKYGKMTAAQLASLHLFDAAIHTLYINPIVYLTHKYVEDSNLKITNNLFEVTNMKGMPTSVKKYQYNSLILPKENMSLSGLPQRMQKPLMQRFFNFSDHEWTLFCEEMNKAPVTEQFFQVLIAPSEGCWSSIVASIQHHLKCMHVIDWLISVKNGDFATENIMLVPSFTMLQEALNVKAITLGRKPIKLIPTYGYIDEEPYQLLKASGVMPLTLYLPEQDIQKRYNSFVGQFRTEVDGHPIETAFGGAMHDVYHAMREMSMSESVAKARWRLVHIAKHHPENQLNANSRPIDETLADGELIYSYPLEKDTMFHPDYRVGYAQKFGDIFNMSNIKYSLHEELKRAFIEDMVVNRAIWSKSFNLGREDLNKPEREIYDELMTQKTSTSIQRPAKNPTYSSAQTISEIGLLANNHTGKKDLHLTNDQKFNYGPN
ncbi:hypothetical protein TUM19329_26180 [Legionella antarctica]|uniref:Uncharacterized protein n=1 Tax=Legionella antarctica TaxID=2708020 RepID=A0A6F8T7X6_9GAMM|nr:ankyrin repeat domain-containing protein [Legionella antarctica]BCA96257.1 hypothetical protein TUM19329_26180 [Legionella antarctica]